jgi:hypothetical protein
MLIAVAQHWARFIVAGFVLLPSSGLAANGCSEAGGTAGPGSFVCGSATCSARQVCVWPCCGNFVPACAKPSSDAACAAGVTCCTPWVPEDKQSSCPVGFTPGSCSGLDGGCLAPTPCGAPAQFCMDVPAMCADAGADCFTLVACMGNGDLVGQDLICSCSV